MTLPDLMSIECQGIDAKEKHNGSHADRHASNMLADNAYPGSSDFLTEPFFCLQEKVSSKNIHHPSAHDFTHVLPFDLCSSIICGDMRALRPAIKRSASCANRRTIRVFPSTR